MPVPPTGSQRRPRGARAGWEIAGRQVNRLPRPLKHRDAAIALWESHAEAHRVIAFLKLARAFARSTTYASRPIAGAP
jgi:hypothetical protein